MDSVTSTERLFDTKISQESLLLEIIKELCFKVESPLPPTLKGKVSRIIADSDLEHHTSLHRLNTADESTSTLLGVLHQTTTELSFDEQAELNNAIVTKIQTKLPRFLTELETLKQNIGTQNNTHENQIKDLQESLDQKLNTLHDQENEKVELMMEWLNHRLNEISTFSKDSSELLTLKTKILNLKSEILHLQILQNIFTETHQSIKAYNEIHKDLKDSIKETEQRIRDFRALIDSDN